MKSSTQLAFIGGGNMASSIIGGLLNSSWSAGDLAVSDPMDAQRQRLTEQFGVTCFADNAHCVQHHADLAAVVLAVKPHYLRAALESMAAAMAVMLPARKPLLISIVAGIRGDDILRWAGMPLALVRVMPNTPALVNAGVSGLYANESVTPQQRELAQTIMAAVGETLWVAQESMIDLITAISGSGPAYFFKLMEQMAAYGVAHGLDPKSADALAVQTALGAATLAKHSALPPATLRRQVTSPGGTTEAALRKMETCGLDDALQQGMAAAQARSVELADELGADKAGADEACTNETCPDKAGAS